MANILEIKKDNFEKEVMQSELPVLVDFWAPWCMPCRMMAPILEELADEIGSKVKITKLNTEEDGNQELAAKYEIQSIPNLKLFKEGKVVADFVGLKNKESLKADISAYL